MSWCSLPPGEQSQGKTCLSSLSLSSGNFERGARGRLVCPGSHTFTNTHSGTPKGVAGVGLSVFNHTHSLNVVCLLVTLRGVPGEGLFVLNHTHAQVDAEGRVELGSIVGGGKEFSMGVSPSPPHLPSHFSHTLTFTTSPSPPHLPSHFSHTLTFNPHSHLTLIHLHPLPTSQTTPRQTCLPLALYPGR